MNWTSLKTRIEGELTKNILPFWIQNLKDDKESVYGLISNTNQIDSNSPRGLVMLSRLLWTYSEAYRRYRDKTYLDFASHLRTSLIKDLWDNENEGFFWTVSAKGEPIEKRKVLYGQAFALYGLSAYQQINPSKENEELCHKIFSLLEKHGKEEEFGGYYEALSPSWVNEGQSNLGEEDPACEKSMNTNLHILEAYTRYYAVYKTPQGQKTLEDLIKIVINYIYDDKTGHQNLYFDKKWQPSGKIKSFGHDVETSWLLWEALTVLGKKPLKESYQAKILRLLDVSMEEATAPDGSLYNEYKDEKLDKTRIWWVQAEYAVSLMNAWMITKESKYKEHLFKVWTYIEDHQINKEYGEWNWGILEDYSPMKREKGGLWKTPYHNGRACMELLERIEETQKETVSV